MPPNPPPKGTGASTPRHQRWQRLALLLYGLVLLAVSLLPSRQLPTIPNWSDLFSPDKIAHFGAYAIFALLLSAEFYPRLKLRGIGLAFVLSSLFGALMEVLQGVIGTGRNADLIDMVANAIGSFFGCLAFLLLYQFYKMVFPAGSTR